MLNIKLPLLLLLLVCGTVTAAAGQVQPPLFDTSDPSRIVETSVIRGRVASKLDPSVFPSVRGSFCDANWTHCSLTFRSEERGVFHFVPKQVPDEDIYLILSAPGYLPIRLHVRTPVNFKTTYMNLAMISGTQGQ